MKAMKRLKHLALVLLLPLALLLSTGAQAATAPGALLSRERVYQGQFADVDPASWYYAYAVSGYEYGLFNGRGNGFDPGADVTLGELLALSARIHAAYVGDTIPEDDGSIWYEPHILYLEEKGILDESVVGWALPATRAQLAAVFALTLPAECYGAQNDALVTRAYTSARYIPDVTARTPYRDQILWMYRQGLLAGMDDYGSYWPDKTTTRAEVAAVVMRIVDPSLRITLSWNLESLPGSGSAAGRTLASLVKAPELAPYDFSFSGGDDMVDAFVRQMLADGQNTITLHYNGSYTDSELNAILQRFMDCVKSYCEQMYNAVLIRAENWRGVATLTFSATACSDSRLAQYREQTIAKAIEVHDMLWNTGQLTLGMSQYEIARVYYRWLCEHCAYDNAGADDDYSISHIAYAALINGLAVCDGYTGAYNLFLKLEGIDCRAVANDTHIWTAATLDGVEYHIDTTWGDQMRYTDMSYFGMTPQQSMRVHNR